MHPLSSGPLIPLIPSIEVSSHVCVCVCEREREQSQIFVVHSTYAPNRVPVYTCVVAFFSSSLTNHTPHTRRHARHTNQFRAMFVQNCRVDVTQRLRSTSTTPNPTSGKRGKRGRQQQQPKKKPPQKKQQPQKFSAKFLSFHKPNFSVWHKYTRM